MKETLKILADCDKSTEEKVLLAYKLGKIRGMKESKEKERLALFSTIGG